MNSTLFDYNYGYMVVSEVGCGGSEASLLDCPRSNASCERRTTNYAVAACSMEPINESTCVRGRATPRGGERIVLWSKRDPLS